MKNNFVFALTISVVVSMMASCACGSDVEKFDKPSGGGNKPKPEKVVYNVRAKSLFDSINQFYRVKDGALSGLYLENYPAQSGDPSNSYLWPYDGLVSGVANLHALGYDVDYKSFVDRFEAYWTETGKRNVGGYASQTDGNTGNGDRFYDDNSIVGLDLVEAYNLLKDEVYIERAGRIVKFLKSGYDDTFGGALWWNESLINVPSDGNSNKPACANAFATLFLLRYYKICPNEQKSEVLELAQKLYSWLVQNLRDPEDNCYWNDKAANGGAINKTKWTYNSGAMISNGVLLYQVTGQKSYLEDAIATAEGSYNYFVRPNSPLALSYPDHDPWFTIKLVKSYIELLPYHKKAADYINTFINNLDYAWTNARFSNGLFYEDWTGKSQNRSYQLLMQDAALESLGVIALYKDEHYTNE